MRNSPASRRFQSSHGAISALLLNGSSKRVVLLHGNSSCKEAFAKQLPALQQAGYGLLAPDLPGHGASENAINPVRSYNFPGYADAIAGLVDQLDWSDYTVIGWSLGGHLALELMATDPRINGAMIVGTPPVRPWPEALHEAFLPTPDMDLAGKPNFDLDDARTYVSRMLGIEGDPPPHLLEAALRTDGRARAFMMQSALAGVGNDARQLVAQSTAPLAVLHGAREAFVRLEYLAGLEYRNLWRSGIQVFECDGHAPHWTNPLEFNALMIAFLDEVYEAQDHHRSLEPTAPS